MALGTWHVALGTWHLALGTWHLCLGTRHLEHVTFPRMFVGSGHSRESIPAVNLVVDGCVSNHRRPL